MWALSCVLSSTALVVAMAGKVLQKVEENLNCLVCLDTYTDPKVLQCHHVFCRKCLEGLVKLDQHKQSVLTCPECRKITVVSTGGVASLQAAFQIKQFVEILKEHRKTAGDARYCPEHPTRELESFCETCDKLICLECVLDQHQGHKCSLVKKLFERYTKEIKSVLKPVESCYQISCKALDEINACDKEILNLQNRIEEEIREHTRLVQEAAEARKVELIKKLKHISDDKRQGLASQKVAVETISAQLSSYLDTVRKSLETSSQGEVVKMKTSVEQQAKELVESFQSKCLKLDVEADMKILKSPDAIAPCLSFWDVLSPGTDPAQCLATGKGLEVATVGEKSKLLLQAIDYEGKPCKKKIQSIECELVSELTRKKVSGNVQRRNESEYEISYQPIVKGRHQLNIKISGQHIRGSPSSIAAMIPIEKLGTPISAFKVETPFGIVVSSQGNLIVINALHSIAIFGPRGDKLKSFGSKGSQPGQFDQLCGVTVNGAGHILVADRNNHRIQQFTAEGKFLRAVGSKGTQPLQFNQFGDITFNTTNQRIYVVDKHCVQILNSDLTFYHIFGKQGCGEGQFNFPSGIACDSSGNVYVADTANHRIQVFTAEGKFLRMFGNVGNEKEMIKEPAHVILDSHNMVYVGQPHKHCVSVFTCEGQFVTSFSTRLKDEKETEFGPMGIAVDNDGLVYVCDFGANKVKIF